MAPATMNEPDPQILVRVGVAFLDLMHKVERSMSPAQRSRFRREIESKWLPRESQAFEASMAAVGMVNGIVAAQHEVHEKGGGGIIADKEFAEALLLEYVALSEGLFYQQLRLVAFLTAQTGEPMAKGERAVRVQSVDEIQGPHVVLENLVSHARVSGFGTALDGIFENKVRRAIAHFDLAIDAEGNVRFYDTDKRGRRTHVGTCSIQELQRMNWTLRDFCQSFAIAPSDYAGRELGLRKST